MRRIFMTGLAALAVVGTVWYGFGVLSPPAIARGGLTEFQKRIDALTLTSASEDSFVASLAAYGLERSDRPANHQAHYDRFMESCLPVSGADSSTTSRFSECLDKWIIVKAGLPEPQGRQPIASRTKFFLMCATDYSVRWTLEDNRVTWAKAMIATACP